MRALILLKLSIGISKRLLWRGTYTFADTLLHQNCFQSFSQQLLP